MTDLKETPEDAKKCLERLLKAYKRQYNPDVFSEIVEAFHDLGKKNLLNKTEIIQYREEFREINEKYLK
jgi:hypothetical protein